MAVQSKSKHNKGKSLKPSMFRFIQHRPTKGRFRHQARRSKSRK